MKRLKELREERGLSQTKLAEQLGTTQQTIHKYEHGTSEPEQKMLKRISDFFNVTTDYLIDHDQNKPPLDAREQHLIDTVRSLEKNDIDLIYKAADSLAQKEYSTTPDERDVIDSYRKLESFQKRLINQEMKKMLKGNKGDKKTK